MKNKDSAADVMSARENSNSRWLIEACKKLLDDIEEGGNKVVEEATRDETNDIWSVERIGVKERKRAMIPGETRLPRL